MPCYFCGESEDAALERHHIIPKRVDPDGDHDGKTVVLCASCHKKVHSIIDPIVDGADVFDDGGDRYIDLVTKEGVREYDTENGEFA